jgi:hypothetical protein
MRNQSDTVHLPSGKAYAVYREDVWNCLLMLLCRHSEPEDGTEILLADSLCIAQLTDVILLRKRLASSSVA